MKGEELLQVFEKTLDLVCIVDKAGYFVEVNPAVTNTLGYTREELFSKPVSDRIHPDDRERTAKVRAELLNNRPLQNFQNRYLKKNGKVVWLHWTSIYLPEKELVFAIAKDVTERKRVEMETEANVVKYQALTRHFKDVVEKDRAFFAYELHEELGQLATVIKMDLEWFSSLQLSVEEEFVQKRLQQTGQTVHLLIDKIRRLSYSMNVSQVDELGLDAVLKALCREFSALTQIPCIYTGSFHEKNLSPEIKRDLFRICQQTLANVAHQADVSEVHLYLLHRDQTLELTVQNNGQDFLRERTSSFELQMLQGRVASINGSLQIESGKSGGTTIRIRIPSSIQ